MISVLAQERLLGAALGCAFTGIVVFEQRKSIYRSISDSQSSIRTQSQAGLSMAFGRPSHADASSDLVNFVQYFAPLQVI
ncbi:hypothetical protein FNV43_RR05449 [Rhamnella rubrinervis]|uniref:Uncharacterized protein n=1 Tax=Rhamnella rubrinervis TaxID=2594499 RepID=A0A8K0MQG5_9ROSA|nr:hypothetical protein FNV43_RR05449 [Rhamnella rubrinervis]